MTNKYYKNIQKRLKEIEDRKLEIILETSNLNKDYKERISELNSEYALLDREQYHLKMELIKMKQNG